MGTAEVPPRLSGAASIARLEAASDRIPPPRTGQHVFNIDTFPAGGRGGCGSPIMGPPRRKAGKPAQRAHRTPNAVKGGWKTSLGRTT